MDAGLMYDWVSACVSEWVSECINEWMAGWRLLAGWMVEWRTGCFNVCRQRREKLVGSISTCGCLMAFVIVSNGFSLEFSFSFLCLACNWFYVLLFNLFSVFIFFIFYFWLEFPPTSFYDLLLCQHNYTDLLWVEFKSIVHSCIYLCIYTYTYINKTCV